MSTALISTSSQPSWEVGIRTLTLELSSGGPGPCWGPSHRPSGGRLRLLTRLQAPSSLFQKWTRECLLSGASVICFQVCGPFLQLGFCPKWGNLGPVYLLFLSAGHSPSMHASHLTYSYILLSFSPWHLSPPTFQYYIIDLILC